MNTFKNTIKSDFTIIPNEIINNPNISWKAKGIFSYLASKPDNWNFYREEIKKHATDGLRALKSGIKELEDAGYLVKNPKYDSKSGKLKGWEWVLTTGVNNRKK